MRLSFDGSRDDHPSARPPRTLRRLLDGAPVPLPALLDRLSERWWAARPRTRTALVVAGIAAVVVGGFAHVAASPFGPPETVLVATRDLAVGERLAPGDLRRSGWPGDLVPADAHPSRAASALDGLTVGAPVPAGSIVTARHVGDPGIAGLIPPDRMAVPVPTETLPRLDPGTTVDLIGRDLHGSAMELGRHATVLADDGEAVWLAVAPEDAAQIAAAGASGMLTAVVRPAATTAG